MKTKYIKSTLSILLMGLIMVACGGESATEEGEHGEEEHGHGEENTVSLTQQQMKAIDLNLTTVQEKNMTVDVQVNGTLEIPPQFKADISPVMGGIVKSIKVIEGDRVKKGQTLAVLQHPDFIDLQSDYRSNIVQLEFLEKEYARQQKLNEEKVTSDKSFQKIETEYKNLKSLISAQKVKLQMLGISAQGVAEGKIYPTVSINSPFNGFVSVIETNVGAYVQPMSRLFEVVNSDEMHADFMVYEKDISKISVGQTVYFTTSSLSSEFSGKIHNISPVFEQNPKALHIHVDIDDTEANLIPGMYISGRIVADNIMTTVLPDHAVVEDQGKAYIFVKSEEDDHNHGEAEKTDDHGHGDETKAHEHGAEEKTDGHDHGEEDTGDKWTFKKVEVIVGMSASGFTEVKLLTPLGHHDKVAGNGAYFLLSEMSKEENEHSH